MDGYLKEDILLKRLEDMQSLFAKQTELNKDIVRVSNELDSLDNIPENIEAWFSSISTLDKNGFTLSDFKKMFKMSKNYTNLVDEKNKVNQEIKLLIIDNLLDRIKDTLKE